MTQSSSGPCDETAEPSQNWSSALVWSTFGLIGWLSFELTAQPAVGVAIFCSRFGWDDFLTALWLRRTDPHRARGRACSWFCLSLGMTRILVAAFGLMMLVTAVLSSLQGARPNQNANLNLPNAFYGLVVLMLVVTPILALFAILGYVAARRGSTQVWIDESLSRARQDNSWPPDYSSGLVSPSQNKARLAWLSTLAIMIAGALFLPCIVVIVAGQAAGAIVLAAESVLIPLLTRRVIAQHPAECWGIPDPDT
jgi:hypothetical protein